MWTVLLKILGILGILLLVILGLALLLLAAALFAPVSYRIQARKHEDLSFALRAGWLLGLVRAAFAYPEPRKLTVKILCFKVFEYSLDAADEPEEHMPRPAPGEKEPESESAPIPEPEPMQKSEPIPEPESAPEPIPAQESEPAPEPTQEHAREAAPERRRKTGGEGRQEEKRTPFEKIRYTFREFCDKIKNIRENIAYYREVLLCEDTRGLVNHAFMRLGKILKSIRPRKLQADIRFGAGTPDATGYAYAIYGILCPYLGSRVYVVPDFEQAVLEGELDAAGHITIFHLLRHGLMFVLDKRLRELIAKLRRED